MFFSLSKLLSFLFHPLTWIVITLLTALVFRKRRKSILVGALCMTAFFGNSFILHEVNLIWEIPVTQDQDLDHYSAAVILGGYAYYSPENDRITIRESGDRLFQGIKLLQGEYVDHLILSGGSGYLLHPELKESVFISNYLKGIGIDETKIIVESSSRNTFENASETAKLLREKGLDKEPILLVTSAYHMRRAKACFEKQGLKIIPYATDPTVGERMFTPDHLFIPNSESLAYWNRLIHEWFGYIMYLSSGYI